MMPEIAAERLVERLEDAYGLSVASLAHIPRGGDPSTIAYRVELGDGSAGFLEVKSGPFDEIAASVAVPRFLADAGLPQVLAPIPAVTGRMSVRLESAHLVLFPFVEGRDAFEAPLTERQWSEFGSLMKVVHNAVPPREIRWLLRVETFAPESAKRVRRHLDKAADRRSDDPAAAAFLAFLDSRRAEVARIVGRTERLAGILRRRAPDLLLCHGNIHAGNLLVADSGSLFIIDWDASILAPKERDLMFVGGGVGGVWNRAEEEAAFYHAYGPAEVDATALAYYRYVRIVEDIAVTADALLLAGAGGSDRALAVEHLLDQFGDGSVVEIAHRTYGGLDNMVD